MCPLDRCPSLEIARHWVLRLALRSCRFTLRTPVHIPRGMALLYTFDLRENSRRRSKARGLWARGETVGLHRTSTPKLLNAIFSACQLWRLMKAERPSWAHKNRTNLFLSNGDIFSIQTYFCRELGQSCGLPSADLRVCGTAVCKLNVMFIKNAYFFIRGDTDAEKHDGKRARLL